MNISFFLGANSGGGFYSLYGGFAAGSMLHIIKGGPGTGKSGFMRAIGDSAQKRGLDVHYVLCSGDPASLDGVYIPALGQAWVDGTAPHVSEPRHFGFDSDYVNLGMFCNRPFLSDDNDHANQLYTNYRQHYQRAYGYLKLLGEVRAAFIPCFLGEVERETLRKRVRSIILKSKPAAMPIHFPIQKCFFSAISCDGLIRLGESISTLCKLIYTFDDRLDGGAAALELVAAEAAGTGEPAILCPSPLDPSRLEAVLLPGRSLGFVRGDWEIDGQRRIRLESLVPPTRLEEYRAEARVCRRYEKELLSLAIAQLKSAKHLHDRLEAVYKEHMDFPALTEFTADTIEKLYK